MNKKISILMVAMTLSAMVYVGCKSDSDNDPITPAATCTDGIMNGTETGIDCGGTCTPCVTCSDGIQNGTETDIDCGGTCTACAAPSMTATISNGFGAYVADTTASLTYADSSRGSGFTTYRVIGKNSASATARFDLQVRFNDVLDTVKTNVEYNVGNINGVYTMLIFYQTVGSSTSTYSSTSGKIKFTKINHIGHKASGTFEFVGSTGAATRTITSGTFTNLPLQ